MECLKLRFFFSPLFSLEEEHRRIPSLFKAFFNFFTRFTEMSRVGSSLFSSLGELEEEAAPPPLFSV